MYRGNSKTTFIEHACWFSVA